MLDQPCGQGVAGANPVGSAPAAEARGSGFAQVSWSRQGCRSCEWRLRGCRASPRGACLEGGSSSCDTGPGLLQPRSACDPLTRWVEIGCKSFVGAPPVEGVRQGSTAAADAARSQVPGAANCSRSKSDLASPRSWLPERLSWGQRSVSRSGAPSASRCTARSPSALRPSTRSLVGRPLYVPGARRRVRRCRAWGAGRMCAGGSSPTQGDLVARRVFVESDGLREPHRVGPRGSSARRCARGRRARLGHDVLPGWCDCRISQCVSCLKPRSRRSGRFWRALTASRRCSRTC